MSEQWPAGEVALLRRWVQDGKGDDEIVELFRREGIAHTYKSVQRKRQRMRAADPASWMAQVRAANVPRYDQPVSVDADRALLLFDVHAPFHDSAWINRVMALADRWQVDTVGIGGDLVDFSAFSKYGRELGIEASDEMDAAAHILTVLTRNFDRVVYSGGNHEMRLVRQVDHLLSLQRVMELFVTSPRVTITDYHWFELISAGQKFYIEHPKNASIHATIVPKKLCAKFHCHCIAGHGHGWGQTRDDSGRYFAIDSGICADERKLAYAQKQHNTRPVMQRGAVIVVDGTPVALSPHNIALYERFGPPTG